MSVRTTVKSIQNIMRQDAGVDGDAQRISQLCWMFFLKIMDDQDEELELLGDGFVSAIPDEFRWRRWAADPEGITGEALLDFVNGKLFPSLKTLEIGGRGGGRRAVVRGVFEDAYNYMKSGQLMRQVINEINEIDFNDLSQRQHFGDIYEQILNDLQSAGNAGEYYTPRAVTAFMADRIDPKPGEILLDPACGTGGFPRLRDPVVSLLSPVRRALLRRIEHQVDLGNRKPRNRQVELQVEQTLQLQRQQFLVPTGVEGELVVGQYIGPTLGRIEMRQRHRGYRLHAQQPGSCHTAMARDDLVLIADEDRAGEPEPADAVGDLPDLFLGVTPRIALIGAERPDRSFDDALFGSQDCAPVL
jgi:hypothetical protein